MKFNDFCSYLEKFEATRSRNEMNQILAEFFKKIDHDEVAAAMYFIQGRIAPEYIPLEFNFSLQSLLKALANIVKDEVLAKEAYRKSGDIGFAYEQLLTSESANLSIREVFDSLREIALVSGKNSQLLKQNAFLELVTKLANREAKYVARIVVGKLRLGLSDKTILDGLSVALTGDKSQRDTLEKAFGMRADLGKIAEMALKDGIDKVAEVRLVPGIPVASKLVEREKDFETIMTRLGEHYVQPKYDGLRMQIHYDRKGLAEDFGMQELTLTGFDSAHKIRIFSRNMTSITEMFPDVVAAVDQIKADSFVIDAEAIGFDPQSGKLLPFQETIQRKRKTDISTKAKETPVKVFVFDILYLNGEPLTDKPIEERLNIAEQLLTESNSKIIVFSESPLVKNSTELETIFRSYVKLGLEGLISKKKGTFYAPGTRNYDWIKLKAKSRDELVDSIDAVVLGYYLGRGQRAKFGMGALLVGTYDKKRDVFLSLAKIGTGIKDEDWGKMKRRLEPLIIEELPENVITDKNLIPDVILKPEVVVVVEADELSKSKVHGGGNEQAFSLRFPRLKEFDRDKSPEQITDTDELAKLFKLQNSVR